MVDIDQLIGGGLFDFYKSLVGKVLRYDDGSIFIQQMSILYLQILMKVDYLLLMQLLILKLIDDLQRYWSVSHLICLR